MHIISISNCLSIHICWEVEKEAGMDLPNQTEFYLSGEAMIVIVYGARKVKHTDP